ncbi:hypothetical protein [Proteiniborus sp. MB09-C3]|uniref:hypothetical protein n=1 Tax=Proteiniborus sp. MB09-C3 TaxID=3050072 RepID=UPI0025575303|nr:hypothetical protein [Proteiniborus sp. MB09-C3]WIV13187.1 hypothetical protein QO263_05620 [Proteiniborus sp. MB09-C3]
MGELILPDIKIIYDIREELRQDPIYWALSLSITHVIVENYSMDAKMIKQLESDNSFSDEVSLMFIVEKDGERISLVAFAVEDNTGLYIRVQHLQDDYYFKVEKNSHFQSLDIVTEESFKHDVRLLKLIKNPSNETLEKFGIGKQVDYRLFDGKRKLRLDQSTVKLFKSLFD